MSNIQAVFLLYDILTRKQGNILCPFQFDYHRRLEKGAFKFLQTSKSLAPFPCVGSSEWVASDLSC